MNQEDHDDLWDLLGKARQPRVSPFFSRNVLRTIREEQPAKIGPVAWLRMRWRFATVVTGALTLVAAFSLSQLRPSDPVLALADKVSASPDYQVISHLDELLDSEENSVWLEASAH